MHTTPGEIRPLTISCIQQQHQHEGYLWVKYATDQKGLSGLPKVTHICWLLSPASKTPTNALEAIAESGVTTYRRGSFVALRVLRKHVDDTPTLLRHFNPDRVEL